MRKINTKSRLELAHLKRQLETRKKPLKSFREMQQPAPPSTIKTQDKSSDNSRFDYKFVFTNDAIKTEDRAFRMKNPHPYERDTKSASKAVMPTHSFLPYGVSIRNPHMFEEDQLAVIQRRQEVQNITLPQPPYNPFAAGSSRISTGRPRPDSGPKKVGFSTASYLRSTQPTNHESPEGGKDKPKQVNPLPNFRKLRASTATTSSAAKTHPPQIEKQKTYLNPTQARDSEFRQQFDALESHKATKTGRSNDSSGSSGALDRAARNKDVIDKLSSTVQQLNQYEERLKQYMKSKNTMAHAGAALKQLRSKRSKTIAQLTKLSQQEESMSKQDVRQDFSPGIMRNSFLQHEDKIREIAAESKKIPRSPIDTRGFPNILHGYTQELRQTKSPLDGERLSSVIGKRILSIRGLASSSRPDDDSKMTPLQAAMMEGIDLNKMSALIARPPDSETVESGPRNEDTSSSSPNALVKKQEKAPQGTSSKHTVSLYRYNRNPMSLLDGETLLEPPQFSSIGDDRFRLFATSQTPGKDDSLPTGHNSEVIQKVYQEFQIHEEKIQRELLRDRGRLQRPKTIDPSIKRIAEFSTFMQKTALNPSRPAEQVHP